jgi:hypothetical protein
MEGVLNERVPVSVSPKQPPFPHPRTLNSQPPARLTRVFPPFSLSVSVLLSCLPFARSHTGRASARQHLNLPLLAFCVLTRTSASPSYVCPLAPLASYMRARFSLNLVLRPDKGLPKSKNVGTSRRSQRTSPFLLFASRSLRPGSRRRNTFCAVLQILLVTLFAAHTFLLFPTEDAPFFPPLPRPLPPPRPR